MTHSRFTKVLFALFISLSFFQIARAQTLDTTIVSCICTDNVRVQDSLSWISNTPADWRIVSYSGFTLPDSILWHTANPVGPSGDEFYLSTDIREKDTIIGVSIDQSAPLDSFQFSFVSFRDPDVRFDEVVFTNGPDTLNLRLDQCTAAMDEIQGNLMITGMDTVCLNQGIVNYEFTSSFDTSLIQSIDWSLSGANLSTGSGSQIFNTKFLPLDWISSGDFTISVTGKTITNCPIDSEIDVHVINTDFTVSGPDFACANGDTTVFYIDPMTMNLYDTIFWEIVGPAGEFVGDSTDIDSVMIAWGATVGTSFIKVTGQEKSGVACSFVDTKMVTIADTLQASIAGDSLFCLGDMGTFSASVNNVASIAWTSSSSINTIIGDTSATSIGVLFNEAGLTTLYAHGRTLMGCPIIDSIVVDVKDSDVMLMGSVSLCVGDAITYSARHSDGSLAQFSSLTWQVNPMIGAMDTTLIKSDPNGPYDSLRVDWTQVGNYQIIVNGMTGANCMLSDTIEVSVIDTNFIILGSPLTCVGDLTEFTFVQAFDSTDVLMGASITWQVLRDIGSNNNVLVESLQDTDMNDTLNHEFHTGTFNDATSYLVIANSTTPNGCTIADTVQVETIGSNDLEILGPDVLCAGTRDTIYTLSLPDSVFDATPVWNVRFANNNPYSPSQWTPVGGDSLMITLPDVAETIIISVSGTIAGTTCTTTTATKQVMLTDMISFDGPLMDTLCLDMDSVVFALNVDSIDVNFNSDFFFQVNRIGGGFTQQLPITSSGSQLATFINWPSAGDFEIIARGYTKENCRINEEIIVTVKDTNYIITGDPQICLGDASEFAFIDASDMMPVDSTFNGDSIFWTFTYNGSTPYVLSGSGNALTGSGSVFISALSAFGAVGDSINVAFDSVGVYELFASSTTDCGNCDVDAVFEVIVRGTEFALVGPDVICNGSTGLYNIANIDSSRIIDLVADSTTWSLASGMNNQLNGDPQADSIFINWNRTGLYTEVYDTLYFSGMTDDGCVVRDTLPIVIETDDFMILGDGDVCVGDPISIQLVNQADSSLISNLDSLIWIVNGTDTIRTPSVDTLDRLDLDMIIDSTNWMEGGMYSIQAIGTTTTACAINVTFSVTVYDVQGAKIMGDMNTCLGSVRFPTDPDTYTINIPDDQITNIMWEIVPAVGGNLSGPNYDFSVSPSTGALDQSILTVSNWGSEGYESSNQEDYQIKVSGTTLGGCRFADSTDVIVLSTLSAFTMVCNNKVNISIPYSCELVLTPDMILENWEYIRDTLEIPADQFEVIITEESTGRTISDMGIVDGSWIGEELKVSVVHECSQQSCWGIVVLEDKNIPDLICGSDTIACADDYDPEDLDFGSLRFRGFPVTDTSSVTVTRIGGQVNTYVVRGYEKCGDATLKYQDRIEREKCFGEFGTIIYRDWAMTNQAGLTSTCTDTILIERLSLDSFIAMFDAQLQDTTFECGDNVTGFTNPSFALDEFCFNIQFTSSEVRSNLCNNNPNTYTATKTWTFLDWCSGRVRTLQQTIAVDDNRGPNINLRSSDIRTQADEHHCFGIIDIDNNDISISDPSLCSDIRTVRVRIFENDATGQLITDQSYAGNFTELILSDPNVLLDLSKIFIAVEATDECGNLSADTVSRMVIVDDNVMPTAVCDANVNVNLNNDGWGLASYQTFNRGSNDNCGPVKICITRLDDLEIFEGLDNDNNNLVSYSIFLNALAVNGREGTNYSDRTTIVGNIVSLHKDSLCTNRLRFECADAVSSFGGTNVSVQMTVTDVNGRQSTCISAVEVRGGGVIDSVSVVRGDIRIDCDDDYSQFIPFDGDQTVRFLTNCGIPITPVYSVDSSRLTQCGTGVLVRRFRATDQAGQVFNHVQTINIGDPNDLINPDNIRGFWPDDYEGPGCPGSNIHRDNLNARYVPNFDRADFPCSDAAIESTDIIFRNVEGYCAKVLRTWTLIDWCQSSTTDPDAGMWEHIQVLKLSDENAPVINASAIEERTTTNANTCSAFVALTVAADDCHDNEDLEWSYVITSNGSQVRSGSTNTINSNFDVGNYRINWNAADPCGNMSETFVQSLIITDGVAPAMACINVTLDFGPNDSITITPDIFAGNTTDGGCTAASDLRYFFGSVNRTPSLTIGCSDLLRMTNRSINLTIVATDEQGNFAECPVILTFNDSQNICVNDNGVEGSDSTNMTSTARLSGEIMTELNLTIDDVAVSLNSGINEMAAMSTAIDGEFAFNNVPTQDTYEIKAKRDDDYLNGVTTFDLLLIERHMLGVALLDSPYKVIAADVDGSHNISARDLVALRKLLLGIAVDLPIQQPWTFVDADQSFDDPNSPFPYVESIVLRNLETDLLNLGLVGVKMGDVNENVHLESPAIAGSRSIAELNYDVIANETGGTTIEIYSEKPTNLDGMQMELKVSELLGDVIAVGSEVVALGSEDYSVRDQNITVSMVSSHTVTVQGQAMMSISFSNRVAETMTRDLVKLINQRINAELYTSDGDGISVADIQLSHKSTDLDEGFILSQNSPNPFIGSTDISFYNNIDGFITTRVYDASGKQVYVNKAYYITGWHKMSMSSDELDGPGLYIYELNNGTAVIRKKMMVLE